MMNNKIEENRITMRNIRTGRTIFFVFNLLFCLFDIVFYIVGGFMFFFLFDLIAVASAFYFGTVEFRNRKLHICLIIANLIAIILYAVIQPVYKFLYISSIIEHVLSVVQLLYFTYMGKEQEYLMNQEGYPYFTEQSAMASGYKEYVPDNDMSSGTREMEDLDTGRHITKNNYDQKADKTDPNADSMQGISKISDKYNQMPRRSDYTAEYSMDEVANLYFENLESRSEKKSDYEMPGVSCDNTAFNEKEKSEEKFNKKQYSYFYNVKPKSNNIPKLLCDPNIMEKNKNKMNSLKRSKKVLFIANIMMVIGVIFLFAFNLTKFLCVSPFYILILFNIGVIISASVISETCLDNIKFCRKMIVMYFLVGLLLTASCFKYTIPIFWFLCSLQMVILEILAKQNDYLKQQEGYPYFTETALRHQQYTENYSPTRDIDFSPKKMDSI